MQISKRVVIGAVGAMIVMVGVIAFLLGRESGRHRAAVAPPVAAAAYVAPPLPPGAIPQLTGAAPYALPAPGAPEAPDAPPRPTVTQRRPGPPALADDPDEAAQVHAYFLRIDEIQAGPSGDPGEVANKLIASSLNGDSSGFDQLITSATSALAAAKAVPVPAPCAAYHAKLLGMLGDSVGMLAQLKTSLASKDMSGLTAIMPAANALQSQTTTLESQARELKKRFGL